MNFCLFIGLFIGLWYNKIYFFKRCNMEKIAIGMSGGVDSSVTAAMLLSQGYDVEGIILRLKPGESADNDIEDARRVSDFLGIKLHVLDCREQFEKNVISPFINEYQCARTPNPCVECNSAIKFGVMLDYALDELECDKLATGHYAQVENIYGTHLLKCSRSNKDQSYFLYRLNQHQLAHAMFPLDGFEKEAIRKYAENLGIPVASKRDSQEICFVPDDDYVAFLSSRGITSPEGNFIDPDGNILGRHSGIINYTVGQRKGLGAFGKPMFVNSLNAENNTVTIGENGTQYSIGLVADRLNVISNLNFPDKFSAHVKIRFRAKPEPATVIRTGEDTFTVIFENPQRSVTPGQGAVIYQGEYVLGGGRIISQIRSL